MLQTSAKSRSVDRKPKPFPKTMRITQTTWALHQSNIVQHFITENKSLAEVIDLMRKDNDFDATESQYRFQLRKWGIKKNKTNVKLARPSETDYNVRSKPIHSRETSPTSSQVYLGSISRGIPFAAMELTSELYGGSNLQQILMDHDGIASREPAYRQIDNGSTPPFGIPLSMPLPNPRNDFFGDSERSCDSGFFEDPSKRDYGEENQYDLADPTIDWPEESHNRWWSPHSTLDSVGNFQKRTSHSPASDMPSPGSSKVSVSNAHQMHPDTQEDVEPMVEATMEGALQDNLDNASSIDNESMRKSPVIHTPPSNASSVKKGCESASTTSTNIQINEWILGANDAERLSSLTLSDLDSITDTPDSAAVLQSSSEKNIFRISSRKLLLEIMDILASQDRTDADNQQHKSHVEDCSCAFADTPGSAESPGDAGSSSGPSSSPKSSMTSGNGSGSSQSLKRPYSQAWGSCEGQENDDEPPSKKPNRDLSRPNTEDKPSPSSDSLMPCPLFETKNCRGTNNTISELIRDLRTNHQVIICVECCVLLDYPKDGRKAEKVLAEHRTVGGCVRKCISQLCSKDGGPLHIRTPNCPSLRMVAPELWRLIWNLINPGQEAPALKLTTGVSYLHDKVRRPRTQRVKSNRVQEIVQKIDEDLEAKERRIIILGSELEASKNLLIHTQQEHEHQLQQSQQESDHRLQRCTQQVKEQEEIILDLLERLISSGKELEQSLQRRLNRVCPNVFEVAKTCAKQVPSASTPVPGPPASDQTPNSEPLHTRPSQQISYVPSDFAANSSTCFGTQPASAMQEAQQTSQVQLQLTIDNPTQSFNGQIPEQGGLDLDFFNNDWPPFPEACQ